MENKTKWKWWLGLIVAIATAVMTYLSQGCTWRMYGAKLNVNDSTTITVDTLTTTIKKN